MKSMKKKLRLLAVWLCVMVLTGCAAAEGASTESAFISSDSDILVACFSATGNTWPLAEYAAAYLRADLFRIEPLEPYTDEDLNYNNKHSRANREMDDETCRPLLASTVENMAQYKTVLLAFPIWWGQAPRIIETFIEAHDFSDKTVLCFCTSKADRVILFQKRRMIKTNLKAVFQNIAFSL